MPAQTPSATAPRGTEPPKPKSTVSYTPVPQQDMIISEQKRVLDESLHHLFAATEGLRRFPLPPFPPQSGATSPSSTDSWNHCNTDAYEDDMSDTDTWPGNEGESHVGVRQLTRWINHYKTSEPDFYYNAIIHHIECQDIQLSLVYGIAASSDGLPDEEKWPQSWNKLYPVMQWITNHLVAAVQSVPKSERETFVKKGKQKMLEVEDGIRRDWLDGDRPMTNAVFRILQRNLRRNYSRHVKGKFDEDFLEWTTF
ncbi:hypothetical protein NW766_009582 [Fusarium irregulare]|uniref:Uncharacterized protein n=1 Tax=Fusarium irregulare TaxID=2494466 RepID=A0A9W8PI25_9HYPO|nr:hypothetical protein NW766_009582 [Fusarium irregulare]